MRGETNLMALQPDPAFGYCASVTGAQTSRPLCWLLSSRKKQIDYSLPSVSADDLELAPGSSSSSKHHDREAEGIASGRVMKTPRRTVNTNRCSHLRPPKVLTIEDPRHGADRVPAATVKPYADAHCLAWQKKARPAVCWKSKSPPKRTGGHLSLLARALVVLELRKARQLRPVDVRRCMRELVLSGHTMAFATASHKQEPSCC